MLQLLVLKKFFNFLNLSLDSHVTTACFLTPKISESNFIYFDLFWNYEGNKVRKRLAKIMKIGRVVKCENLISEGAGKIHNFFSSF